MINATSSTIVQRLWNYCNVLHYKQCIFGGEEVEAAVEAGLVQASRLK